MTETDPLLHTSIPIGGMSAASAPTIAVSTIPTTAVPTVTVSAPVLATPAIPTGIAVPAAKTYSLNQNIGWEGDYYRCCICLCRMSVGWIEFLLLIGTVATTSLGGYAQLATDDSSIKFILAIVAAVAGTITALGHIFKKYASDSITENLENLESSILLKDASFTAADAQTGATENV